MSENFVRQKFSRHIDIRGYCVRESVKTGIFKLIPLPTHKMVAHAMTKSPSLPAFVAHRKVMLGQVPLYIYLYMYLYKYYIHIYIYIYI